MNRDPLVSKTKIYCTIDLAALGLVIYSTTESHYCTRLSPRRCGMWHRSCNVSQYLYCKNHFDDRILTWRNTGGKRCWLTGIYKTVHLYLSSIPFWLKQIPVQLMFLCKANPADIIRSANTYKSLQWTQSVLSFGADRAAYSGTTLPCIKPLTNFEQHKWQAAFGKGSIGQWRSRIFNATGKQV